ncbi:hypothetical protein ACIRRA_04995 [Nocardia sp. NPDC101769]|uniref:hypothetical protein n=1 Tax=Nocardia sp. NPDC101769 TaxID=3364333 RepID=UPI0037F76424
MTIGPVSARAFHERRNLWDHNEIRGIGSTIGPGAPPRSACIGIARQCPDRHSRQYAVGSAHLRDASRWAYPWPYQEGNL